MALMANINRDPKRRPQPFDVDDFLPRWGKGESDSEPDDQVLLDKVRAMNAALGGAER